VDQISKYIAEDQLSTIKSKEIIKDKFYLTLAKNRGAAYGILKNKQKLLLAITIPATIFLVYVFIMVLTIEKSVLLKLGVSFMLGGAMGNIIDRIRLKYVIDFLYIKIKKAPIFNIADLFIFLGTIIIMYLIIFTDIT